MRRAALLIAAAILLAGPTALAFFSGGFFEGPRLVATFVAWTLVLTLALLGPRPLPTSRPGRVALAGLVLIAAWTGISLAWAPLSGPATDNLVRLLLYLGAFLAAAGLLGDRRMARAVEPALALGALVVIGYGLAGRMLPGILDLAQSSKAYGRLEQPITYWNAEGALAAVGLVLCARLAGTSSRTTAVRVLAAAASGALGMGVYLSYSRGAIAAAVVGLIVLLAAAPSWSQLRAAGIALGAGALAAASAAPFSGVTALEGSIDRRQADGATVLGLTLAIVLAAGILQARTSAAERRGRVRTGQLRVARHLRAVAVAAVALGLAGLVAGGLAERGLGESLSPGPGASRLTSVESRRYDYWRIGIDAFARHPLEGIGAGGFRVVWLRERPVPEGVLEVHSLPLEMATELGLVGLLGLSLLVGGVGVAGRRALRRHPAAAPGACAAVTVWFVHASIDWTWQIPAVTLPTIVLAASLVAGSDAHPERDDAGAADRGGQAEGAAMAAPDQSAAGATGRSAREPSGSRRLISASARAERAGSCNLVAWVSTPQAPMFSGSLRSTASAIRAALSGRALSRK